MSLYCFGKAIPPFDVFQLVDDRQEIRIVSASTDDINELEMIEVLRLSGTTFAICDPGSGMDATALWNEAMNKKEESTLYQLIRSIILSKENKSGAIAFVDGGIDTVVSVTKSDCLAQIIALFDKHWDANGNPLFVWQSDC